MRPRIFVMYWRSATVSFLGDGGDDDVSREPDTWIEERDDVGTFMRFDS